jgi:type II secretory pathway component PulJ
MLIANGLYKSQRGINLVELMVGIAISLVLLTGVLSVMLRMSVSGGEIVQSTRLNQQLRGALDLMTKEIQRAGYVNWSPLWDEDGDGIFDNINGDVDEDGNDIVDVRDFYEVAIPAMDAFGDIRLFAFATPGDASSGVSACTNNCDCILYSYDIDGDGALNADEFELFGFRLNDGAIEMRTAGETHSCNSGTWQDVTDDSVTVTSLEMTRVWANSVGTGNDSTGYRYVNESGKWTVEELQPGCTTTDNDGANPLPVDGDTLCLWRSSILINVTGELSGDAAVSMQLQSRVKPKNDYLNTSAAAP